MSRQDDRSTSRQSFATFLESRRATLENLVYRKTPIAIFVINLVLLVLAMVTTYPFKPLLVVLNFVTLVVDALVSIVGFASCVLLWNLPQTTKKKGILISAAIDVLSCLISFYFVFRIGGF